MPQKNKDHLLAEIGTHELWHTLEYSNYWDPQILKEPIWDANSLIRREGLNTKLTPPTYQNYRPIRTQSNGLYILGEAFTDYCTSRAMEGTQYKFGKDPNAGYKQPLDLLNQLLTKIPEDIFFQAAFTKNGFRDFYRAFGQPKKDNKLRHLITTLNQDYTRFLSLSIWLKSNDGAKKLFTETQAVIDSIDKFSR